jgi:ectoine hydroxylase-related dioxygenase (phytanoyl-CoA dioxygenase family)
LHDIDDAMGPTRVWPETHRPDFHQRVSEDGPPLFQQRSSVALTLRRGDGALMDSRLWHCGGANLSKERRYLLVLTFAAPGALPDGSTHSILRSLQGKHTLRSLRERALDRTGRHAARLQTI